MKNCSGQQTLCHHGTGTYISPVCKSFTCAKLYAANTNYAKDLVQRQVRGLNMNLEIQWLGNNGLKRLVQNHIQLHPKIPMLFYWWTPDEFIVDTELFTRVRLPKYDPKIDASSGACDFDASRLSKFVSASMPPRVVEFVKNFRNQSRFDKQSVAIKEKICPK